MKKKRKKQVGNNNRLHVCVAARGGDGVRRAIQSIGADLVAHREYAGCRAEASPASAIFRLSACRDAVRKMRSEEHTSELQSRLHIVCRLLLGKKTCLNEIEIKLKAEITEKKGGHRES